VSALLTIILCNGKPLHVANCTRWRATDCAARCTRYGAIDGTRCQSCAVRRPIMGERWRGLGDVVRACIRVLFLGRLDIAERLAARVEALWSRRRPQASTTAIPGARRPCGCKARQQALNRALPFG
jgi:hypothetical protein